MHKKTNSATAMNDTAGDAVFKRGIRGQILILKITGMACCLRPLCTAPVIAPKTQNLHNKQPVSGANTTNIAQEIKKLHNKQTFSDANLPDIAPEFFVLLENRR